MSRKVSARMKPRRKEKPKGKDNEWTTLGAIAKALLGLYLDLLQSAVALVGIVIALLGIVLVIAKALLGLSLELLQIAIILVGIVITLLGIALGIALQKLGTENLKFVI